MKKTKSKPAAKSKPRKVQKNDQRIVSQKNPTVSLLWNVADEDQYAVTKAGPYTIVRLTARMLRRGKDTQRTLTSYGVSRCGYKDKRDPLLGESTARQRAVLGLITKLAKGRDGIREFHTW